MLDSPTSARPVLLIELERYNDSICEPSFLIRDLSFELLKYNLLGGHTIYVVIVHTAPDTATSTRVAVVMAC